MEPLQNNHRFELNQDIDVFQIQALGNDLLEVNWVINYYGKEHVINLKNLGWTFSFNRYKRAIGLCDHNKRAISISEAWWQNNTDMASEWEDTIRHEVAHALHGVITQGGSDHSNEWRNIAIQVGARPRATTCNFRDQETKYVKRCPKCGKTQAIHKVTKKRSTAACGECCRKYNGGRYTSEFMFEVVLNPNYGLSREEINRREAAQVPEENKEEVVEKVIGGMLNDEFGLSTSEGDKSKSKVGEKVIVTHSEVETTEVPTIIFTAKKRPKAGTKSAEIFRRLMEGQSSGQIVKEMGVRHPQVRYVRVNFLDEK